MVQKMGLVISVWGPCAWNTLHVIAHTYPERPTEDDKNNMFAFLKLFAKLLPCPTCSKHFCGMLDERFVSSSCHALTSRANFVEFIHDLHNEVNKRLGKRIYTLEEDYEIFKIHSKNSRTYEHYKTAIVFCLFVAVVYAVYKYKLCRSPAIPN